MIRNDNYFSKDGNYNYKSLSFKSNKNYMTLNMQ
jgi:hypothetical protein